MPSAASEASVITATHHAPRASKPAANTARAAANAFESMLDDNNAAAARTDRTDAPGAAPPKSTRSNDTAPDRQGSDRAARPSNQSEDRTAGNKAPNKAAGKASADAPSEDATTPADVTDAQPQTAADQGTTTTAIDLAMLVQAATGEPTNEETDATADDTDTGNGDVVTDPNAAVVATAPPPTQNSADVPTEFAAPIVPVPVAPAPPPAGEIAGDKTADAPTDPITPAGAPAPIDAKAGVPGKTPTLPVTPDATSPKPDAAPADQPAARPADPKAAAAAREPAKAAEPEAPATAEVKDQAEDETKANAHGAAAHRTADQSPAPQEARPDAATHRADTAPADRLAIPPAQTINPPATMLPPEHLASATHIPAAADTASAANAASTPVPLAGVAVEIAARVQAGTNRFEIRLDPPELGRIDVRLDVDRQGQVTSRLVVEKAETLDMLRREAPQLERALEQAGFKTGDSGLQFSLRDQSGNPQRNDRDAPMPNAQRVVVPDEDMPQVQAARGYGRLFGANGGVDIRV